MEKETSIEEIPTLHAAISDIDLLGIKLQEEITHLEKWMDSQLSSNRKSNEAIVNTIRGLIETRQNLLETLQKRPTSSDVINEKAGHREEELVLETH